MKTRIAQASVLASALILLACSGLPGKFMGVGSVPSTEENAPDATFKISLIAEDKEPDENNFADTFRGRIGYTDEGAGVDIRGKVADGQELFAQDDEVGGVYDDVVGLYGVFAGYWVGEVPDPEVGGVVTEGIFVIRVKDETTLADGSLDPDRLQIQIFDAGADWDDIDDAMSDNLLYVNWPYNVALEGLEQTAITNGDIRHIIK